MLQPGDFLFIDNHRESIVPLAELPGVVRAVSATAALAGVVRMMACNAGH